LKGRGRDHQKGHAELSIRLEAQVAARFETMFNSRNVPIPHAVQEFEPPIQTSNFSVHGDIQVIHILISFEILKYF
jgi:hypothetical protein